MLWDPLASGFACQIGPMSPQPIDLSTKSGSIRGLEPHLSEVEVGKCSGTPLASVFACQIGPMSPQPIDLSTKSGSIRG